MTRARIAIPAKPGSALAVDAAFAILCLVILWLPIAGGAGWRTPLQVALMCAVLVGVLSRWRWPIASSGVVAAATMTAAVFGLTHDPFVATAWTLYPLAVLRGGLPRKVAAISAAVLAFVLLALTLTAIPGAEQSVRYALLSALVLGGSWSLGAAAHQQLSEANRAARNRTESTVIEERLRIAREVHDIVSHSLGTIGVRAGVARVVSTKTTDELRQELGEIETTSRAALADVAAVLGALRDSSLPDRTPQPQLSDLPTLVSAAAASGVACTLTTDGTDNLTPTMQLTVYRIVQEAVTNVIRHAPGANCFVSITADEAQVAIHVSDDGPGRVHPAVDNNGLVGIRERATLLGGSYSATNRDEGGFAVRVWLPQSVTESELPRD